MKAEIEKSRVLEAASKCPESKETLKVLFPEFFEETYRIGQFFNRQGETYILSQVDVAKCVLVSLRDGNRFSDPVKVDSVRKITASEFESIKGKDGRFTETRISISEKINL